MIDERPPGPPAETAPALIARADHDAAVIAARAEGAQAAMARVAAAIGAEGVKSEPGRLAAAADLLFRAPDMAGEAIAAFAIANIAAAPADAVSAYSARRAALAVVWSRPGDDAAPSPDAAAPDGAN